MNSEDRARINKHKSSSQIWREIQAETENKADTRTIAEGDIMIAFINHPGWTILKREMEATTDDLLKKLVNCHGTIKDREALQQNVKMLQEFVVRPDKYVDNLKRLHARKLKGAR